MAILSNVTAPLPLNFSQTFLPDRRLLAKLLPFAANNGRGNKEVISAETSIPTGKSTGKVHPMIYYAQGMNLISASKAEGEIWQLGLTDMGKVILREDPFLSELQTLWLLHLMLCRRYGLTLPARGIADPWFALFSDSSFRLGHCLTQTDYLAFLKERHGDESKGYLKSLTGVILRSYLEESCFGNMAALQPEKTSKEPLFIRQSAPTEKSFFPIYAAGFYQVWDELFPGETQLALTDFSVQTGFFNVLGWNETIVMRWLEWLVDQGLIQMDRHTGSAMLLRLYETEPVFNQIYSGLV
jgi:hypothetical protein